MTLSKRIDLILASREQLEPFTGNLTRKLLEETFLREASGTTARLPKNIVHIISGNTPHAAFQTLLNGVLLGAQNLLKLPSQTLLDFEVPIPLQPFVEVSRELPAHWIPKADAMVVFGSDNTIRHFQSLCPLEIPFVGHGHRIGIAIIDEPTPKAAQLAARDIGLFNQSGCLSLQTIYLKDPFAFGPLLAEAMTNFEEQEYIKAKSQLDTYALSMLIRQMENSERAITLLMDTINEGDVAPRMFEVLSDLQRTLLDIIKSQTMYMVAVEENVKKISRDLDVYHGKSNTTKNKQDDKVSTRGTKDLMRALQDSLDEENIEDIDSDENEK